jgi:hypothetical protein
MERRPRCLEPGSSLLILVHRFTAWQGWGGIPTPAGCRSHLSAARAACGQSGRSPNPDGLPAGIAGELLAQIISDRRVVAIDVPEYTVQRDLDGGCAASIVMLVTDAMSRMANA